MNNYNSHALPKEKIDSDLNLGLGIKNWITHFVTLIIIPNVPDLYFKINLRFKVGAQSSQNIYIKLHICAKLVKDK